MPKPWPGWVDRYLKGKGVNEHRLTVTLKSEDIVESASYDWAEHLLERTGIAGKFRKYMDKGIVDAFVVFEARLPPRLLKEEGLLEKRGKGGAGRLYFLGVELDPAEYAWIYFKMGLREPALRALGLDRVKAEVRRAGFKVSFRAKGGITPKIVVKTPLLPSGTDVYVDLERPALTAEYEYKKRDTSITITASRTQPTLTGVLEDLESAKLLAYSIVEDHENTYRRVEAKARLIYTYAKTVDGRLEYLNVRTHGKRGPLEIIQEYRREEGAPPKARVITVLDLDYEPFSKHEDLVEQLRRRVAAALEGQVEVSGTPFSLRFQLHAAHHAHPHHVERLAAMTTATAKWMLAELAPQPMRRSVEEILRLPPRTLALLYAILKVSGTKGWPYHYTSAAVKLTPQTPEIREALNTPERVVVSALATRRITRTGNTIYIDHRPIETLLAHESSAVNRVRLLTLLLEDLETLELGTHVPRTSVPA